MALTPLATLRDTIASGTVRQQTVAVGELVGFSVGADYYFGRARTNSRDDLLGTRKVVVEFIMMPDDGIDMDDPTTWAYDVQNEKRTVKAKDGSKTVKVVADRSRMSIPTVRLTILSRPAAPTGTVAGTSAISKFAKR